MQQLIKVHPSIIHEAAFNIAVRYNLIRLEPLTQSRYVNTYGFYSSHGLNYDFMSRLTDISNLGKTLEDSDFSPTNANFDYNQLISKFIGDVASIKKFSREAIGEALITEVRVIQGRIIDNESRKLIQQQEEKAKQKHFEELIKTLFLAAAGVAAIATVWTGISEVGNIFNQRFLNIKEIERLRIENARVIDDNKVLQGKVQQFERFKEDFQNVEKVKAENEELKDKNNRLNSALAECKTRPIWKPCR